MVDRSVGARLRGWVDRNLPRRETFESNRWLRPLARRILHPSLWSMNRRSIPRGVALGMFTGILIPMGQIPACAVLALPIRANVPAAALTTFFTNPVTTPFLLYLYYKVGRWTLALTGKAAAVAEKTQSSAGDPGWNEWIQHLAGDYGLPTLIGMVLCSIIGAILGYVVAALGWRWWISSKWRRRSRERNKPSN